MKLLLNLLIRLYVNKIAKKEIVKLSDEQELDMYQFRTVSAVEKVLKSNITMQTLRHFEATSDQERWMVKGAALALQVIKDRHNFALAVVADTKDKNKRLKLWKEFKLIKK